MIRTYARLISLTFHRWAARTALQYASEHQEHHHLIGQLVTYALQTETDYADAAEAWQHRRAGVR